MQITLLTVLILIGCVLAVVDSFNIPHILLSRRSFRRFSCEGKDFQQSTQSINNTFQVSIYLPVLESELSNENLVKIVNLEATDEQCNQLCWKCLGYRYVPEIDRYENSQVFPRWKERFPDPPDLIGIQRIYDPVVDKPVRDASVSLMRSIPPDFKGGVRSLINNGFRLFKISELTPNKTRRAQV